MGIRAQTVEVDNSSDINTKDETAVAVRLWKNRTGLDDGKTIVAAFIDGSTVVTSKTTDGGATNWTQQSAIPWPSAISSPDGLDDEKLAYRLDGSGNPELVSVFRCFDYDGSEGTFVNFSSDDGNSWETPVTMQSQSSWTDATRTSRPFLAADNNSTSLYRNHAYVAWTLRGSGTNNHVYVATVTTAQTIVNMTDLADGATNVSVDACDVAVDASGHVFVLWRKTHTDVTPNTRDLYLSESTDGGSSWPSALTYTVLTSSPRPSKESGEYQDCPCLGISQPSCGSASAYVAYCEAPADTTNNPSDLYYTSAALSNLSSWSTTIKVDADDQITSTTSNTNPFSYQFEPAICPDAGGGVFILYYSQQDNGSAISVSPVLYEADAFNSQEVLNPPAPTLYFNTTDYIAMVWNQILLRAYPVWTDINLSSDENGIFSIPSRGTSSTPSVPLGDLAFSNQRRIVTTGSTAHLSGFGELTPSATINKKHAVWYSEGQIDQCNSSATAWTDPLEIDAHDFDEYTNSTGTYDAAAANGTTPAIGTYERGGISSYKGQRAVAEVWTEQPPNAGGYIHDAAFLYIRTKEYDVANGEAGSLSSWSPIDSIQVTSPMEWGTANAAVAPLTAPVPASTKERYLIGWVITYPRGGYLQSVTYLRGQTHGSEGSSPASNVLTQNEDWTPHKGSWSAISTLIDDWASPDPPEYRLTDGNHNTHGTFVSITSNESNGNGTGNPLDLSHEIVFTGDGTLPYSDVWDLNPTYVTTASSSLGSFGTNLGEATAAPYLTNYWLNIGLAPQFPVYYNDGGYLRAQYLTPQSYQRNPSVTITSTGQKIASWEQWDSYWSGSAPLLASSIQLRKTDGTGTWDRTLEIITETANDFSWTWLRNPSVTAFPKTPLTDAPDASDQDPGSAELLYWVQNELSGGVKTEDDYIEEEQFYEIQGMHWDGTWHPVSKLWYPIDPATNNNYVGANTQRSFGIYNNGPRYNTWDILKDDAGNNYIHGLSYGIANSVTGGTPQPQLSTPIPDVGALKGTFDTALNVQLYRDETRIKGSSMVTFKWGKVYVDDSAFNLPIREVKLNNGIPDSDVYASHDAIRDSIFQTEWFDWPVSAEIHYDRMMLIPSAGIMTYKIDTGVFYDSIGGSHFVYDTLPSSFTADTTHRTDSAFFASGTQMKYTVQLIHQSGHVDTIEQAVYNPSSRLFIKPAHVTIANASHADDTVMLRVVGDFVGIPDSNRSVGFARETSLDTAYSFSLSDTTVAIDSSGGIVPPPDTCFAASGPYSNPSNPGANDVSILVHYCASGASISAQVYTSGGTPVGPPSTYTSDGQIWDRLPITAPGISGTYYITVTVGSYFTTLGYSVY